MSSRYRDGLSIGQGCTFLESLILAAGRDMDEANGLACDVDVLMKDSGRH